MGTDRNQWTAAREADPEHSQRYIERWKRLQAEGRDIVGEARLVDAMAPRHARILDAGCGTGRIGGYLAQCGHHVVGVDLDPELIEAARGDFPDVDWRVQSLSELEVRDGSGARQTFDVIVSAGNVMGFLADAERAPALRALRDHLADGGRLLIGYGAGRGWSFDEFLQDAQDAGFTVQYRFSSWDLRPANEEFLVAVLVPQQ